MSDRLKTISLRRFREQAAEIHEPVDIAVRDRQGNFQIIGFFTPYMTYPPDAKPLVPIADEEPPVPGGTTAVRRDEDGRLGYVTEERAPGPPSPRMIRTPAEAAAAAPQIRPFPKSAQTGRRRP